MTARRTRGIAIDELPPAAQAAAKRQASQLAVELGPNSPLRKEIDGAAANSHRAAKRTKSGGYFQLELARTHRWYQETHRALIRQHHPATHGVPAVVGRGGRVIRPGTLHFREGGAACDFGGIARVAGKVRGILFDAKVITGVATYAHLEDQYHQLEELRDHQALKGIGFLLLADQALGIAYLVQDVAPLLTRESIVLRETPRRGATKVPLEAMGHMYPFVIRPPDFSPVAHYARWDWLGLLEQLYAASNPSSPRQEPNR